MFSGYINLVLLDLSNFNTNLVTNKANIFSGTINSKICINDNNLKGELENIDANICEDLCFTLNNPKIIPEKFICIANCYSDSEYTLEYNNICYKECPQCTSKSPTNINLCEKICNEE